MTTPSPTCESIRTAKSIKHGMASARRSFPKRGGLSIYDPHPSDIIVTTFPKAGTTLMQQLVYQTAVLTGGAPKDDESGENFSDICDKAPWINYIHLPNALPKHYSNPRVFKTHSPSWRFQTDKQKHIVVIRNPIRFPVSWLDFSYACFPHLLTHSIDETVEKILFDDVMKRLILGWCETDGDRPSENDDETDALWGGSSEGLGPWFEYTKGWFDKIEHGNVVMVCYEDVVSQPDVVIDIVAKFMQRSIDAKAKKLVRERCTKEYMQKDNRFKSVWDARVLGVDAGSSKVLSNDRRHTFAAIKIENQFLEEIERQMDAAFGCQTYEQLRKLVLSKQKLCQLLRKT